MSRRAFAVLLLVSLAACRAASVPAGRAATASPAPVTSAPAAGATARPGEALPEARYGEEVAPALSEVEAAAAEALRERLGRSGPRLELSGALVAAARELARRAAEGAAEPLAPAARRAALARARAIDPAPGAFLVRGLPYQLDDAVRGAAFPERTTHAGVGAAPAGAGQVLVVLTAERRLRLAPFPGSVRPGGAATLSGALDRDLGAPRVFVALPSGEVREVEVEGAGAAFRARVSFPEPGRYVVEVIGEDAGGPRVAALLPVIAGAPPPPRPALPAPPEPEDRAEAEAQVVRAVNALRSRHGLGPVRVSIALTEVARAHSERMRDEGRIAHVLPGSGPLVDRLRAARVPLRRAYENVSMGPSALAAHEENVESPAHRLNLLRAGATEIGVGLARGRLASGTPTAYLTQILVEPSGGSADGASPEARIREALWGERRRAGAPPLTADPALDRLARETADAMRATDRPEPFDLDGRALALPRGLAAVDVFVASDPADAVRSANVGDRRFRRVGVGVASGDSRRFGPGRLYVAVVYTD